MGGDEERRQRLKEEYEALSPEERRGRIYLNPVFRDPYNRISQAHRQFPIPAYLWERWVPELGLLPVAVYVELRRMTFVNDATGERRTIVWPKQETLAKRLGVKKRHTISAALRVLEEHGFIERWRTTYNEKGTGRVRRGVTTYDVKWEFPLVAADAVELLIEQIGGVENDQSHRRAEKRPYGPEPVENSHRRAEKRPSIRAENRPCELLPLTITKYVGNVENVLLHKNLEEEDQARAAPIEPRKRLDLSDEAERLAAEIGDVLHSMEGDRFGEEHRSAGFHRLVAAKMPERLVRKAIMATRDAVDGRSIRGKPSAYFAGVVKQLAADEGIDLGLKTQTGVEHPVKGNQAAPSGRGARSEGRGRSVDEKAAQEAREAVKALREKWAEE